jgi:16S rRNA A1518/A1519 N6-dimethyltransferase RsmA/KsgA/DIM1 with predicted DNA glycosylase/AP lyase activity
MELILNLILLLIATTFTITMILALNNFLIGNVPFVPSKKEAIENIKKLAEIKSGEMVTDLGSGDGRVLIQLCESFPNAKYVGFEINKVLAKISRLLIRLNNKRDQIKIVSNDFLSADLSKFDVIIIYGIGKIMPTLEQKLKNESKNNGLRVVSNTFTFPESEPVKEIDKVRLYKF